MSEKKSSKKKGRRFLTGIFRVVLVCFAGVFLYAAAACGAENVTVTGNYHESDDEILELLGNGPLSKNTVFLWLSNRGRKVKGNTFVDTLTVDFDDRNSVTVNVSEKKLIGYVEYNDKYWYFNRSGLILVSTEKNTAEVSEDEIITESIEETIDDETSAELLMTGIKGTYALSGACLPSSSGMRMIFLAADEVIYGDEVEENDGAAEGETYDEPSEDEYDDPDGEVDEEAYDEPSEDEYDDPDGEVDEEAYDEPSEDEYGNPEEEVYEETEENNEIISPEAAAEESSETDSNLTEEADTQQTWKPDTSAKGGNYLPLVKGLVFSEAVVGYPLPVQFDRVFSSIAVLKSFVDRSGYVPDNVSYTENGDLIVTYTNAAINLGNGENIEQRVSVMGEALPSFAGLSGTLHLENYDGTQKRLIFSKN